MNDQGGAPGASGETSDGLGRAIGFVTEFNQNAVIFGSAMMLLADLYQRVDALEKLQMGNWMMLDPEGYGTAYANAATPGMEDGEADPRDYVANRDKAKKAAQEASPLYALENRMVSLEGMLGISKGKDDKDAEQANPLDEIRDAVAAMKPEIDTLETDMTAVKADATITKDKAASANTTAGMALARANEALAKANALPQSDATDWRAHHNKPD